MLAIFMSVLLLVSLLSEWLVSDHLCLYMEQVHINHPLIPVTLLSGLTAGSIFSDASPVPLPHFVYLACS